MPQKPNKLVRVIVPIALIVGGIGVGLAVFTNTSRQGASTPNQSTTTPPTTPTPTAETPVTVPAMPVADAATRIREIVAKQLGVEQEKVTREARLVEDLSADDLDYVELKVKLDDAFKVSLREDKVRGSKTVGELIDVVVSLAPAASDKPSMGAAPPPAPTPTPTTPITSAYTARQYPTPDSYAPLGSLDAASGYEVEVKFSRLGAGIDSLTLTNEFTTIYKTDHEVLQHYRSNPADPRTGIAPFGVVGVNIDGVGVRLLVPDAPNMSYWEQKEPGVFTAEILDASGTPVLRLTRQYVVEKGSYDVILRQEIENVSAAGAPERTVKWLEFGPVDLPIGTARLGMDKRRVRFGYLNNPQIDPSRQIVDASRFMIDRPKVLGESTYDQMAGLYRWPGNVALWPNQEATDRQYTLAWVGMTSRHFGVVQHRLVDATMTNPDKSFPLGAAIYSYVLPGKEEDGSDAVASMTLESAPIKVAAGAKANLDTGVYAGPLARKFMGAAREPRASIVGLERIIVYTLGGPCAFCTFQPITKALYLWLTVLHDYIVFDYALAIILLVACMRLLLHPVTRHAQISMQRFSKQMQALAPKQKKIQERYKDEPQKMREELARLMREEHISYSSAAKGCITPLLQTPIWIALYAMLFFMFELRHEPAFFGVFQWLSNAIAGKTWSFLADLSEPDHFIPFGTTIKIPVLRSIMGDIDGLNLLPLLLGVVFYIQQKYMTPPSTTPLTPEQQQQQKMMKVITVVMFPLFMYNQPSALTLYFVVNSTLGIFESRHIRRHAEKMDLLAPPPPRKDGAPKRPGFFQRLQTMAEEKQKEIERRQKEAAKKRK